MKNQYFGDDRDLFKYDLVLRLMTHVTGLRQFTFLPMLTPPDKGTDGNKTKLTSERIGGRNEPLCGYLSSCSSNNRRDVKLIAPYFHDQGIPTNIHAPDMYFSHLTRRFYFSDIPQSWLEDALVLFDPDNGLENRRFTRKHLRFDELKQVWDRATSSVLVVFQYIPRVKREEYIDRRCAELEDRLGVKPSYITDNQLVFFAVARGRMQQELRGALDVYADRYARLQTG